MNIRFAIIFSSNSPLVWVTLVCGEKMFGHAYVDGTANVIVQRLYDKIMTMNDAQPTLMEQKKEMIHQLWLAGAHAEEIAGTINASLAPEPPMTASQVYVIANRLGLPRRIVTESGLTLPVIEPNTPRHPPSPKQAGFRLCIRVGCGKRFWSLSAGDRLCSKHKHTDY